MEDIDNARIFYDIECVLGLAAQAQENYMNDLSFYFDKFKA